MTDYGNVQHPAADVLQTVKGEIHKKSSDPADVIPEAVRRDCIVENEIKSILHCPRVIEPPSCFANVLFYQRRM